MKTKMLLTVTFTIILISCSPAVIPAPTKTITHPAILTSAPTLPPTLTPIPTFIPLNSTPTALYAPIKLSPADEQVYQKALNDIPIYRQGDMQISLQDEKGKPLSGYQIKYSQVSNDFNFGSVIYPAQIGKIQAAGINYWDFQTQWRWIQPQENKFTFDFLNYWQTIDEIKSTGYKTMSSGLFILNSEGGYDYVPSFLKNLAFDEFQKKEYEYISTTVKEIGPAIDVWEGIGEPNFVYRNPLNFSKDQYYQAIYIANKAIRDNDPTSIIEINLGVACGEISWESDMEIVQGLLDRNIDFDQIGLQFYNNSYTNNNYYMGRDSLASMSECWDDYEKVLTSHKKKMNMTEMSVSSDHKDEQLGYWDVPWTEETQAQYLETFYTVFFAKPTNTGLTWYFTIDTLNDTDPFVVYKGGLIRADGTPKKAYYALQNLIKAWTTSGEGHTDQSGAFAFRGFGGDYEIEIVNPQTGESMVAQMHVSEQKSTRETIIFQPNKQLLERKAKLEKLVGYWESKSEAEFASKGHDYLALVNHHLQNAEWAMAEQTISTALDELAITTELNIPVSIFSIASQETDFPIIDNGRVVIWGSDTLYYPYDFPPGTVSVEIKAHAQSEKGELPFMITGVGANYSEMWKVENTQPEVYSYTVATTGREKVFTIRCPYVDRIQKSIIAQNGNVGGLKLFIDEVNLIIKTAEVP